MNIEVIRNMSDDDLRKFLNTVSQKNNKICCKCGSIPTRKERIGIYVFKFENRKLCTLCKNCYEELLDYLGVCDIE